MTAWCHGALGIGAVRLRLYEASGDMTALAEASAAIQAARLIVMQAGVGLQAGQVSDVTLCHGLGGAAELLLLAYEVFDLHDHLRAARQVGRLCLNIYTRNGQTWTCGLHGAEHVPGLFLGLAGIGTTLLRLHDPSATGSPLLPGRLPAGASAAIFGQAKP
jgi:lantibiotic modifying enzyme